ncbi:MAG: endolytic transglycosylase MltG [candidate division Zixibacteria bacterium]|nr:endolytic transglycosylase MltG [candidate division Zixibacteria bacterium]
MKPEYKYITIKDWIVFFFSTLLIFLSSVLLVIFSVIFTFFRLVRRRPLLVFVSVFGLILLFFVIQWVVIPISWQAEGDSVYVIIKHGDNMSRIVDRLNEANLIKDGTGLLILAKLLGKDRHIQAGRYDFEKGMSLYSVFNRLVKGDVALNEVTIPEGLTIKQIAGILRREIEIDSSEFVRVAMDSQFAQNNMDIPVSNLEGYLFPDTYKLSWGMPPEKVAQILVEQFKKTFTDSLLRRAEEINFSLSEVVTLASMIEAEAKDGEEREMISAVYHNRLKRGMLLQCDPTVIYALSELDRPLLLKDLKIDSPYNTYKYPGLPPGPICNPGKASIFAALYPADADYLYFVAKGDGTHIFSTTLKEHNKAKIKIKRAGRNR